MNDISDEVTLDVRYLEETEGERYKNNMLHYKLEKRETFELDSTGRPLRYKILVYDMRVLAVLYNTGESIE